MKDKTIDYWMYRHACRTHDRRHDNQLFEKGYKEGQYHFTSDAALMTQLIQSYGISLHKLGKEWLALGPDHKYFGQTPMVAVCKVVLADEFRDETTFPRKSLEAS